MHRLGKPALAAFGFWLLLGATCAAARAEGCDEDDPESPARSTRITLAAADLVDENGDVLRSFVETDSLGKVAVAVVSATPGNIVRAVTATPQVSRYSPLEGERLKGIAVTVSLTGPGRGATVVLSLRQVCAKYFRDSYLYY